MEKNGIFFKKIAFSDKNWWSPLNRSDGAPVEKIPFLDLGQVERPVGYKMHPNLNLELCRKFTVNENGLKFSPQVAFFDKNW